MTNTRTLYDLEHRPYASSTSSSGPACENETSRPIEGFQHAAVVSLQCQVDDLVVLTRRWTYGNWATRRFVRTGVSKCVLPTFADIPIWATVILQGKGKRSMHTTDRCCFNTTLGVVLVDVPRPGLPQEFRRIRQGRGVYGRAAGTLHGYCLPRPIVDA